MTLAVSEIRQYGEGSLQVIRRLRAMLEHLIRELPEARRPPLRAGTGPVEHGGRAEVPGRGGSQAGGSRGSPGGRRVGIVTVRADVGGVPGERVEIAVLVFVVTCMVTAGLGLSVRRHRRPAPPRPAGVARRGREFRRRTGSRIRADPACSTGSGPRDRSALARRRGRGTVLAEAGGAGEGRPRVLGRPHAAADGRECDLHADRAAAHDPGPIGGPVAAVAAAPVHDAAAARGRRGRQESVRAVVVEVAARVRDGVERQP